MRPLIRRRQRSDITFQLPGVIVHTRVALAGVCPLRMTFILMLSWTMLLGQEIRVGVPSLVARAPEHRSFTEPILTVHPVHPDHLLAAAMIEAERASDGGHAFSIPLFVTDACGPPPAFQLSALAVDTSTGPFRDRLYFLCGARERGPITLTFSADRGETWSTPAAVPPALHDSEPRRILGLAVNNKGVLAIAHLDHIAQSGDSCQALYFVASLDGGLTFLPPRRVSSAPCTAFGDYFGMISTPDGRFHLVWPEVHCRVSELRTVIVEVEGHGAPAR